MSSSGRSDFDIRNVPRESPRIADLLDPESVRAALSLFAEVDAAFVKWLTSLPGELGVTRPEPESWSLLEHMRHLLFANQLHFCHWVVGPFSDFSPLGLASSHLADRPLFAEVGTAIDPSLTEVIAERAMIRHQINEFAKTLTSAMLSLDVKKRDGPDVLGKAFQGLCWHEFGHFRCCDEAVRKLKRRKT